MRTSVVTPYAAYLRVYEPLAAFAAPDRSMWADYVAAGDPLEPASSMIDERSEALSRLSALPPIVTPPRESRTAFVLTMDGSVVICPLQTRLRAWLALEEAVRMSPSALVDAFAPRQAVEQALADLRRWRDDAASASPHILTNPWFVPLRWFVPFLQDERVVQVGAAGPRSVVFRTPMVEARRRVARALRVLERRLERWQDRQSAAADGSIVTGVADLGRWLEEFHPFAWVELDYGGLVDLIDDVRLAADCSAADVAEALGALAADDPQMAAAAYSRLMERWRAVQALGHAS